MRKVVFIFTEVFHVFGLGLVFRVGGKVISLNLLSFLKHEKDI